MCNIGSVDARESKSSRELFRILRLGGPKADALKKLVENHDVDRTSLWRYSKGKTTPPADIAAKIDVATDGEVPADGWDPDAPSERRLQTPPPEGEKAAG